MVEAPPGRYGLQAFHDANANHRIDRDFLGLPAEGIGFGNDAPMRFGPPDFADARLRRFFDLLPAAWAERIARLRAQGFDVLVYFDNDEKACVAEDARRLQQLTET